MQDIPDLLNSLKQVPNILAEFVKTIPDDKMNRRRGDGFWTVAEHLSHLAQVQPMLLVRLERIDTEDHAQFVPYIPGEDESSTPEMLPPVIALAQFAGFRETQLALLESTDPAAWQKTATHPEYDQYSLIILVRHILMHDYWHMYRMEELWLTKEEYLTKVE
jgi:uncharacterized damage-inducible protein DinB